MAATAHDATPTRRQRFTRSWMIAAAAAAIAFPLGLIVAYGDTDGLVGATTPTAESPAAPTPNEGFGAASPNPPTQLIPGRPDGYWVPHTEPSVPPRVR